MDTNKLELKNLTEYESYLYGCRFCPMCKPAADAGYVTGLESHTTRGRALILWRIAKKMIEFGHREAELIYQSTLDSISEAWCIHHYPVSSYMLAARREIFLQGKAPEPVAAAIKRKQLEIQPKNTKELLFCGEIAELASAEFFEKADGLAKVLSPEIQSCALSSGAIAFGLGDFDTARTDAEKAVKAIVESGAKRVIADGPKTLFCLNVLYPALGVPLPDEIETISFSEAILSYIDEKGGKKNGAKKVFIHDARSAFYLADSLASDGAIQPGLSGSSENSGTGPIFDITRSIAANLGYENRENVWTKTLSKSSGADDGLWFTYPDLAARISRWRLKQIKELGAESVLCDSPLDAAIFRDTLEGLDIELDIVWTPEVLSTQ